jgi:hypothetical protein
MVNKNMTLPELIEKLQEQDQNSIIELLDISSEELVEAFLHKIEDIAPDLISELMNCAPINYSEDE